MNVDVFTIDNLGPELKEFSKTNNIVYSTLMKLLRRIISGLKASKFIITLLFSFLLSLYLHSHLQQGPGVSEIMTILGKEEVIARLNTACSKYLIWLLSII